MHFKLAKGFTTNEKNLQLIEEDNYNELIQLNYRLVIKIAKGMAKNDAILEELVSQGLMGLYEAAKRYNPIEDVKFISYAKLWIEKYMREYIKNDMAFIRVPINKQNILKRYKKKTINEFYDVYSDDEFSEGDKLFLTSSTQVLELDKPHNDLDWEGTIAEPDDTEKELELEYIKKVNILLSNLKDKDRDIIEMKYGINRDKPLSIIEIAKIYNVSHQAISHRLKKIMNKLKNL